MLNFNDHLLDLIFINFDSHLTVEPLIPALVPESIYDAALHIKLIVTAFGKTSSSPSSKNLDINFGRANFPELYAKLSKIDWTLLENMDGVNDALNKFYSCI